MPENIDLSQVQSQLAFLVVNYGLQVLGGIIILILGWLLAGWASKRFRAFADGTPRIDSTIGPLLAKVIRIVVLALTGIVVLKRFGVDVTSLIAILGAAGLAIGLALQGTLSNVASGIMLLTLRPIEAGDLVEVGGTRATVDEIGLMLTKLHTPDNVFVAMPNSEIWGKEIRNFSRNGLRRIDLVFGIGYDDDMSQAMEIVRRTLAADERVLKDPAPMVAVGELADSSVNLLARPWVKTPDYFATKVALTQKMKERFDQSGISIPYPQRDLHVFQASRVGSDEEAQVVQ